MDGCGDNAVPVVECRQVAKTYTSLWAGRSKAVCALRDASLQVREGTILGLIGPNGAGKTTFLSLMAGLLLPTEGLIRICGHPARSLQAKRHLGYVPESPAFLACYSARAVLRYHAALHGLSRRDVAVETDRLLQQVKLEDCAGRAVGGFSLGMRQRLALAVALIDRPRLLLLDEPSNGLDPIGVIELRRVLSELRQSGATVIISSHRLAELEKLTSDYVFLDKGRIVRFGEETAATQERRLRVQLLPGATDITDASVAPRRLLELSETQAKIAVSGIEDVPAVVSSLVKAGAHITGVHLETEDVEDAFVRLCQERAS
jgi:ABC-2 type transport system ATP-binding protein